MTYLIEKSIEIKNMKIISNQINIKKENIKQIKKYLQKMKVNKKYYKLYIILIL